MRVSGDSVVYPPAVADFLARVLVGLGGDLYLGQRVVRIDSAGGGVSATLAGGGVLHAGRIVVATGVQTAALLPELPVFGRKGHLAITDRYPGTLRHQVVSMNYGQPAPGADALSVAANVQPRGTGQWLLGSCRQDHQDSDAVDPAVLAQVLRSAIALLPRLANMNIVRTWTGMRPATPDGKPLDRPPSRTPGRVAGLWPRRAGRDHRVRHRRRAGRANDGPLRPDRRRALAAFPICLAWRDRACSLMKSRSTSTASPCAWRRAPA
ncbi:FAD-binding oxidoreductase [Massilia sp. H-1]|nr:FAD-binding oxidoreductase [Massilia sp. H-1]